MQDLWHSAGTMQQNMHLMDTRDSTRFFVDTAAVHFVFNGKGQHYTLLPVKQSRFCHTR